MSLGSFPPERQGRLGSGSWASEAPCSSIRSAASSEEVEVEEVASGGAVAVIAAKLPMAGPRRVCGGVYIVNSGGAEGKRGGICYFARIEPTYPEHGS